MLKPTIFREYDIRGAADVELLDADVVVLGQAFGTYLIRHAGPNITLGRDTRLSSPRLRDALMQGLKAAGCNVTDLGVVPTPLLYYSVVHLKADGGVMITGSHNPPEFNGFKICVGTGSLHGDGIQRLRQLIEAAQFPTGNGTYREEGVIDGYIADIVARTGTLSRRLKVVFDCGNGVGAVVAPELFSKIGIDPVFLYAESDGTFPNHHPDPTVVANLQDLIAAVKREKR